LSDARARVLETIELCRKLVDSQVRPDREFAGWAGQEVLVHLTAYTRAASAILRAAAEAREPTPVEFYGRELTDDELEAIRDLDEQNERIRREHSSLSWYEALERCKAELGEATLQATRLSARTLDAPGPDYPPEWRRLHLYELVDTLARHYEAHLGDHPEAEEPHRPSRGGDVD
jgi:hypothetical protein